MCSLQHAGCAVLGANAGHAPCSPIGSCHDGWGGEAAEDAAATWHQAMPVPRERSWDEAPGDDADN